MSEETGLEAIYVKTEQPTLKQFAYEALGMVATLAAIQFQGTKPMRMVEACVKIWYENKEFPRS